MRQSTEAALHDGDARFKKILQNVPSVAVQGYSLDGITTYWNRATEQLYGYSAKEALGQNLIDLIIPPEMKEAVRQAIRHMAETGRPIPASELSLLRKDGSRVTVFSSHAIAQTPGHAMELFSLDVDLTARKQTEAALQESEERYHLLFDSSLDSIFLAVPDGRILAANPAACRLLDRTEEEIKRIGRNGVVDTSDPRLAPAIETRRRTGLFNGELTFLKKNGAKILCDVSSSVFKDKNGNERTSLIVRDITERQRVLTALRESEERYQRITEAVTDYIYTVRVMNGRATETNHGPGCLGVTGYETYEFTNDPFLWYKMVTKEDRPLVEAQARRILAGEDPLPIEHRIAHKNGTIRWVRNTFVPHRDIHGVLTAYDGLIQNITARKQAEKAIAALALRNQTLLQTASDGIHVLDEQGNVVEANSAFCNLLGYTREEALQLNVADWDRQWSREELLVRIGELIKCPAVFETRHRRKDGTLREVEINGIGVSLEGQNYLYASARDITERKQAEANKGKLAAQNQQLQKADSLSRMAGAIAHHFNNQLQSVMLRLELAINDLPPNIEPVESLTEAMHSARKAAEMSTLMLTYLGQTYDKNERLDLAELCARSLDRLRAIMPRNVVLQTELPSPGPEINANAPQIQQVLTHLVTNAWEACSEESGSIRLIVKKVPAAGIAPSNRFPLDWQPVDTAYACLEITDTGGGVAAQDIEKLFDPFFSSKFTGRGLGLSVVLGIVRVCHGAVTVESKLGQGSVFRVFLPLSPKTVRPEQ